MYREEVVKLMSDTIDNYNRFNALSNNIPTDQMEDFIRQGRDQMEFVNGMIYDTLKEYGIIP